MQVHQQIFLVLRVIRCQNPIKKKKKKFDKAPKNPDLNLLWRNLRERHQSFLFFAFCYPVTSLHVPYYVKMLNSLWQRIRHACLAPSMQILTGERRSERRQYK